MSIENFAITGTEKEELVDTCEFLLSQQYEIKSMDLDPEKRILIFYNNENYGKPFPMKMTPAIMAEIVEQFIEETPQSEFNALLSGHEEFFTNAWELFSPDWYSDEHGLEDYNTSAVIACRPNVVEYTK